MRKTMERTEVHRANRSGFAATTAMEVEVAVASDAKTAGFYMKFLRKHGIKAVVRDSCRNGQAIGVVLGVMKKDFERAYELIESQNMENDYFGDIRQFDQIKEDDYFQDIDRFDETKEDESGQTATE